MPWIRAYVDKKKGGDHVRVHDFELAEKDFAYEGGVVTLLPSGRKKLKLKQGEEANHFAWLTDPPEGAA